MLYIMLAGLFGLLMLLTYAVSSLRLKVCYALGLNPHDQMLDIILIFVGSALVSFTFGFIPSLLGVLAAYYYRTRYY